MNDEELILCCPECGSPDVTLTHEQMFMANTGEHYCHSVKTYDSESQSTCLSCRWEGTRANLTRGNSNAS